MGLVVSFPKGKQNNFLKHYMQCTCLTPKQLSEKLNVCDRTIRDWISEKHRLPISVYDTMQQKLHFKNKIITVNIQKENGLKGWKSTYLKYGRIPYDENFRLNQWKKWNKNKNAEIKNIKPSIELAEFVGIMVGDGHLDNNGLSITLHYKDDKNYGEFVTKLIEKLFSVKVHIYYRKERSINSYNVFNRNLSKQLNLKIGIIQGNKTLQQIKIPNWILQNKKYSIACTRGLFDTDGCVYWHKYKSNNKEYQYKKIAFRNYSYPVILFFTKILKNLKIKYYLRDKTDVRIENQKYVKIFLDAIKSNNPKHIK